MKKIKHILAISLILILALSLVGCGASGHSGTNPTTGYTQEAPMTGGDSGIYNAVPESGYQEAPMADSEFAEAQLDGEMPTPKSNATGDSAQITVGTPNAKKIITTYNITLETIDYEKLVSDVESYVTEKQGYVEYMDSWGRNPVDPVPYNDVQVYKSYGYDYSHGGNFGRTTSMTVRIPQNETEAFIKMLKESGNETNYSVSQTDISLDYYDVEARIEALRVERDKIMELMEQAENVQDIILLEQRLTDVNYELDSKETQMRHYDNQIDYNTVYVSLQEVVEFSEQQGFNPSFGERVAAGFRIMFYNFKTGVVNLAIWLIVNSVYIVVCAGVVALIVVLIRKRSKVKAKENK